MSWEAENSLRPSKIASNTIGQVYWRHLYVLEKAERLKSHARAKKVVHTFAQNPLYILRYNT